LGAQEWLIRLAVQYTARARRCAASGSARVMPMALHLSRRMHPIT